MPTDEQLQRIWKEYQQAHGHVPAGTKPAIEWAVDAGLIDLPDVDPYTVLASRMARALRMETATNDKGLHYRVNQAVRVTKNNTQYSLWAIGDFAPAAHSIMSLAQRRNGIVDDNIRLSIDSDVHNDKHPLPEEQYHPCFDYTDDVAEGRAPSSEKTA
jgi:hypothetical protein